jgi:hypothetical protein
MTEAQYVLANAEIALSDMPRLFCFSSESPPATRKHRVHLFHRLGSDSICSRSGDPALL